MKRFIFAKRGGIYIIDLAKSLAQLREAQRFVYETVARGKNVLFVGTKKAAQEIIKEAATRCGHHYIISRWLGGTLTNNQNIAGSIRRMRKIQELDKNGAPAPPPHPGNGAGPPRKHRAQGRARNAGAPAGRGVVVAGDRRAEGHRRRQRN